MEICIDSDFTNGEVLNSHSMRVNTNFSLQRLPEDFGSKGNTVTTKFILANHKQEEKEEKTKICRKYYPITQSKAKSKMISKYIIKNPRFGRAA